MATPRKLSSGSWFVQVRLHGVSHSHTAGTKLECELWQAGLKTIANANAEPSTRHGLASVITSYLASDLYLSKKPHTRTLEKKLSACVSAGLGHVDISNLTSRMVRDYRDTRALAISARTKRLISGTKVRLELATLSAVCNYAIAEKLIDRNPCLGVPRPADRERKERVEPPDITAILMVARSLGDDAYWFFVLMYSLGSRPGELANLERYQVNVRKRQIFLPDPKNGEPRVLLIPDQLLTSFLLWFNARPPANKFVWQGPDREGREPIPVDYYGWWRRIKKQIPLGRIVPHTLRHERVSRWVEAGMSDARIKGLSGVGAD
jgi:integrase